MTGAAAYAFDHHDAEQIAGPCVKRPNRAEGCPLTDFGVGAKLGFWVLLVLSLPVALTMALSMLPLVGTDGQAFLFEAHRWSALVFGWVALLELYALIRMEIRREFQ